MKVKVSLFVVFFLSLLAYSPLNASHFAGGELFYEWIGDEAGKGQYDYRVYATIYRNTAGIPIGTGPLAGCFFKASNRANATALAYNYQNPNLPLNPQYTLTSTDPYGWIDTGPHPGDANGWDIPAFEGCATSPKTISEYRYVAEVTLSGPAADWVFALGPLNARDQNDNIAGGDWYIEVELNNLRGHNSSPRIVTPAARAFCVLQAGQKPFEWFQTAAEEDGDSLQYGFDPSGSLSANGFGAAGCANPQPIAYTAPYTPLSPLPSNPPVQIDQQFGIFTLSPTVAGSFVVKIQVQELRFDTVSLQYLVVGETVRELQVPIATSCKSQTEDGPELDLTASSVRSEIWTKSRVDSLKGQYNVAQVLAADSTQIGANYTDFVLPVYQGYDCFDNSLTLDFDVAVKCATVHPTDFRLIGPDGIARPINDVNTNCAINGVTNTLQLNLFKPLDRDGNYLLQIRTGNDGNTIENECGYEINAFYSALVEVGGCPAPEYQLDGLTVQNDLQIRIDWSGNNDLLDTNILNSFNKWNVLRREKGQNAFQVVAAYDSATARFYVDPLSNNGYYVDNFEYEYALSLVYNGKGREYTRFCNNIVLRQDTDRTDLTNMGLYWNPDICIPDSVKRYNIYRGEVDSVTQAVAWEFVNSTQDTSYNLARPEPDSVNEGMYAVKVISRNPNGTARTDSSESNWVYYALTHYPPEEQPEIGKLIIPNVITPNGDGTNDRFYVQAPQNGDAYEQLSFTLYNRWGNKVFEDPQFHLRNNKTDGWNGTGPNGKSLSDGVYYYVIELNDPLRNKSETLKGNLNLLGGGL